MELKIRILILLQILEIIILFPTKTFSNLVRSTFDTRELPKPTFKTLPQRAVHRVMPPDSQSFDHRPGSGSDEVMIVDEPPEDGAPANPVETATDMVSVGNNVGHALPLRRASSEDEVRVAPSTSSSSERASGPRMIRFNVQYCDRIVPIDIAESGTLGEWFSKDTKVCLINVAKLLSSFLHL